MLLSFDDTDGPQGGCTTYLAFHALAALPRLALGGMPRLVRLNPNVPWKTRGNAAVSLPLVRPEGPQTVVGEVQGRDVLAFPEAPPAPFDAGVADRVEAALRPHVEPGAACAVAVWPSQPPGWAYGTAVRTRMDPEEARVAAAAGGAHWVGQGRGLVGTVAAAAWPGPASSYELIAYRSPGRRGRARAVDPSVFAELDQAGVTFHSWDPSARRPACVPSTPCPVLVGLRGRDAEALRASGALALRQAVQEPIEGWLLWATNQASGDHVSPVASVAEAPEWSTMQVAARVVDVPKRRRGGHVHLRVEDGSGASVDAVAFEPTKGFRDAVEALRPGDDVVLTGAWDGALRLEKVQVLRVTGAEEVVANPRCACGDRMKSRGRGAGYRCPSCRRVAGPDAAARRAVPRDLRPGVYEVPVMARRHLHRPVAWSRP